MQESELILLLAAAQQVRVIDAAMTDVLNRGREAFQGTPIDAIAARQWAERLKHEAPHVFGQTAPASSTAITQAAAASAVGGRAQDTRRPVMERTVDKGSRVATTASRVNVVGWSRQRRWRVDMRVGERK